MNMLTGWFVGVITFAVGSAMADVAMEAIKRRSKLRKIKLYDYRGEEI